jgi:hypothetical protein
LLDCRRLELFTLGMGTKSQHAIVPPLKSWGLAQQVHFLTQDFTLHDAKPERPTHCAGMQFLSLYSFLNRGILLAVFILYSMSTLQSPIAPYGLST